MNFKAELRQKMLQIRDGVEDFEHKNMLIFDKATKFVENFFAKKIFSYVSMQSEVDTKAIISYYISKKDFEVYIPYTQANMSIHRLLSADKLKSNRNGNILQSEFDADCYDGHIDLVLVPLLAFDRNFFRLGYGGGYYDKFLSSSNAFSLGLAFDEQEISSVPYEKHDIPLNAIITPTRFLAK